MKYRILIMGLVGIVLLTSGFSLSPQSGDEASPTPGTEPRPELRLSVQDLRGFAGAPVFLTVRLLNAGAMEAARNAALLAQAERLDMDSEQEAERFGRSLPDEEETEVQPLPLNGDWREHVVFELERGGETDTLDPVLLSSTGHTSTEIGILPMLTTWAIPPDITQDMATGDYTVTARMDPTDLFTELDLDEDMAIEDSARFSLMMPANDAERALMKEINALYYVGLLDCESAVPHAMEAVRLDPERVKAYWYAAQCEAVLGNTDKAIELLEDLLARTPPMKDGGEFYIEIKLWLEQLKAAEDR